MFTYFILSSAIVNCDDGVRVRYSLYIIIHMKLLSELKLLIFSFHVFAKIFRFGSRRYRCRCTCIPSFGIQSVQYASEACNRLSINPLQLSINPLRRIYRTFSIYLSLPLFLFHVKYGCRAEFRFHIYYTLCSIEQVALSQQNSVNPLGQKGREGSGFIKSY